MRRDSIEARGTLYPLPKTTIITIEGKESKRGLLSKPASNHPWRKYKVRF